MHKTFRRTTLELKKKYIYYLEKPHVILFFKMSLNLKENIVL